MGRLCLSAIWWCSENDVAGRLRTLTYHFHKLDK